jgi:hypothetical protein
MGGKLISQELPVEERKAGKEQINYPHIPLKKEGKVKDMDDFKQYCEEGIWNAAL